MDHEAAEQSAMTVYLFTVVVAFLMINVSEAYRCKRLSVFDFLVNSATSVIPVLNLVVSVATVHMAINK